MGDGRRELVQVHSGQEYESSGFVDFNAAGAHGLRALLSGQLWELRQLLHTQHRHVLGFAEQERLDFLRQVEAENAALRQENQRLHDLVTRAGSGLFATTGVQEVSAGTGEASSGPAGLPSPPAPKSRALACTEPRPPPVQRAVPLPPIDGLRRLQLPGTVVVQEEAPEPPRPAVEAEGPRKASKPEEVDQIRKSLMSDRPEGVDKLDNDKICSDGEAKDCDQQAEMVQAKKKPKKSASFPPGRHRGPASTRRTLMDTIRSSVEEEKRGATQPGLTRSRTTSYLSFTNCRTGVFPDADKIKEKVRTAMTQEAYSVLDHYKAQGVAQRIARSQLFELASLTVISLNAIYMSVDVDYNRQDVLSKAHPFFQVCEHFFCSYFFIEIAIRFAAFQTTMEAIKDAWFSFDACLVALMVFETWVMSVVIAASTQKDDTGMGNAAVLRVLRLVRIARMARVVRLMRACPELVILIKGMLMAGRSVFFTLCLLVSIIYVFAIGFTLLTRGTQVGDDYFRTVPDSMNSLVLYGCLGENLPDVALALGAQHILLGALLMLFVLLASLTVMNMLIGILVEVVSIVAAVEKETLVVNWIKEKMESVISELDPRFELGISRPVFLKLLQHPESMRALRDVGVDVVGLVDFADYFFSDGDHVSFADFMELVLQLRGSNKATVRDIVDLRKSLKQELQRLEMCLAPEHHRHSKADASRPSEARPSEVPTVRLTDCSEGPRLRLTGRSSKGSIESLPLATEDEEEV